MIKNVGIIGFGSFGKLLAEILAPHVQVMVHSRRDISKDLPANITTGTLEEVGGCQVVVIANNLADLEETCVELKPLVNENTIVLDVCSVKVQPTEIMSRILGGKCHLLATHPLFGPQSYANNGGSKGLRMVWHEVSGGPFPDLEELFGSVLGLNIMKVDPDTHDKDMAWVHGLTFFVGRALLNLNPPETPLATHYYKELMDLVNQEKQHSYELFMTIQQGNPYTDAIRKKYMDSLDMLESQIIKERS